MKILTKKKNFFSEKVRSYSESTFAVDYDPDSNDELDYDLDNNDELDQTGKNTLLLPMRNRSNKDIPISQTWKRYMDMQSVSWRNGRKTDIN